MSLDRVQMRIQNDQLSALLEKMSRRYHKYWDDANLIETLYHAYTTLFSKVEGDFERIEAYVETSIRNRVIDHCRAMHTQKRLTHWEPLSEQIADQNPSPEAAYLRKETREKVREVLDTAESISSGLRDSLVAVLEGDVRNWCTSDQGRYAQQRRFGFTGRDFHAFKAKVNQIRDRIENSITYAIEKVKGTTIRVTKSVYRAIKSFGESLSTQWNRWEDRMKQDVRSQYVSRSSFTDVIKTFNPKEWFGEELRKKKVLLRYYPRRNKKSSEKFYILECDRAYMAQDGSEIRSKYFYSSQLVDLKTTLTTARGMISQDKEVKISKKSVKYMNFWESHKSHICPTTDSKGRPKPPTKVLGVNHIEILLWKHRRSNGNCYYTCKLQWNRNGRVVGNFYHSQIPMLQALVDEALDWIKEDLA